MSTDHRDEEAVKRHICCPHCEYEGRCWDRCSLCRAFGPEQDEGYGSSWNACAICKGTSKETRDHD